MKRVFASILILFAFSFGNVSAFSVDIEDSIFGIDIGGLEMPVIPELAPVVNKNSSSSKVIKKWTVMVFVNGKNDLEGEGLSKVNQMEDIGSNENMNIVVEIGRMKGQARDTDLDGDWTGSRRLYIKKDRDDEKITSPILMETKDVDMGDYKRIVNFVRWAKLNYPAKKYMFIIWNHGSGFFDPVVDGKGIPDKGVSYDNETGNYVRTAQIGKILKEVGGVDILAFDACLMQMAEVAFEVKDHAKVILASPEVILGYPYNWFLYDIAQNPNISVEDLGSSVVDSLKTFYNDLPDGIAFSAIRTSKLDEFSERLSRFVSLAIKVNDKNAIKKARNGVLRYRIVGDDNRISFSGDISHFAEIMLNNIEKKGESVQVLKDEIIALRRFISEELMINVQSVGLLKNSGGIAAYFPPMEQRISQCDVERAFEGKYQNFSFAKESGWYDFVSYIYSVK